MVTNSIYIFSWKISFALRVNFVYIELFPWGIIFNDSFERYYISKLLISIFDLFSTEIIISK